MYDFFNKDDSVYKVRDDKVILKREIDKSIPRVINIVIVLTPLFFLVILNMGGFI